MCFQKYVSFEYEDIGTISKIPEPHLAASTKQEEWNLNDRLLT